MKQKWKRKIMLRSLSPRARSNKGLKKEGRPKGQTGRYSYKADQAGMGSSPEELSYMFRP